MFSKLFVLSVVAYAAIAVEYNVAPVEPEDLLDEMTLSHMALIADDDCQDMEDATCALNAAQLRAHKVAAAKAAKAGLVPDPEEDASALAKAYGQCGGAKYTGPTTCPANYKCQADNEYYAQCVLKDAPAPSGGATASAEAPKKMTKLSKNPPMPAPKKTSGDLPAIVIKGNFLYNSATGERWFSKGIAYNPRNIKFNAREMHDEGNCTPGEPQLGALAYAGDPTIDEYETMWRPALEAMANAGMNTVRLYNIDPEENHDKFMAAAAELDMYVVVPLTRHDWGFLPAFTAPECYTGSIDGYGHVGTNLLTSAKLIVKQFSKYTNTLMYTVANELTVNDNNGYAAYPCVKALARDIHTYQQNCSAGMRRIPLIYADMDMGPPDRKIVADYMTCQLESEFDVVDAHGINVYSWCNSEYPDDSGKDNFQYSPYYPIVQDFEHFDKPLLMTEFGCNLGDFKTECPYAGGRTWADVKTFFNQFSEILSGALAFEFSMETNGYGIALTPGFTSDAENDKNIYFLDSYYALAKEFKAHNVDTKWGPAQVESCKWMPTDAAPLTDKRVASKCPDEETVAEVFKRHHIKDAPNWNIPLPPTPPGADQGDLAECPNYEVPKVTKAEGCCHMTC